MYTLRCNKICKTEYWKTFWYWIFCGYVSTISCID